MNHGVMTLALLLFGCTGSDPAGAPDAAPDAASTPDAPATDSAFACAGMPLPTTAPDPLTASGRTVDLVTAAPLAGATIAAFDVSGGAALSTSTSDSTGAFVITTPSGGRPIDGYLVLSLAGYLTTYDYSAVPISANVTGFVLGLATQQERDTNATSVGITPLAGTAVMLIRAVDCNDVPLAGVTITTEPAGEERYIAGGVLSATAAVTDSSGIVFVYNVPSGAVTVRGTIGSRQLRDRGAMAYADADTYVGIQP